MTVIIEGRNVRLAETEAETLDDYYRAVTKQWSPEERARIEAEKSKFGQSSGDRRDKLMGE